MEADKQSLKSIITGKTMQPQEVEYAWQEFVLDRIKDAQIDDLLDEIKDNKLADKIRDRIGDIMYTNYNHGFLEGMKLAGILNKM